MPCLGATEIIELASAPLGGLFNFLLPIHQLWWAVLGTPISWALGVVYSFFSGVPVLNFIGAYGLAIIVITAVIKLILSPLYEYQIRTGRRTMINQRKLAPELAELRKKHKGDPQKLNAATMELYREHGINPLASMSGCLPSLIQLPILDALYWVFRDARQDSHVIKDHFLFIPHLNLFPSEVPLIHGLPIPHPIYLVLPLLAAGTTFVQSRMMQQPKNPLASEQEQSTTNMMKSMQFLMPVMIFIFSIQVPAGLALYWFVSNLIAIGQQYRVNGWGGLRPEQYRKAFEEELQKAGLGPGPRSSATGDKIVAKRSSADRALPVAATSGAAAGSTSGTSGSASRNQSSSKNANRGTGGGGGSANKSGNQNNNGKGSTRPSVAVPSGGQGARSQASRSSRRGSTKRTRKPTR